MSSAQTSGTEAQAPVGAEAQAPVVAQAQVPVIEIRGLWTQFGSHIVHRGIDLDVMAGEVVSLVGGSGCGKTTLMRQVLALESPSQGEVKVFGIPVHGSPVALLKKIRKRWGVLFQQGALYSALSVYDNIALPLRELRAFDEDFVHDIVMMKLDMVDMERRHAGKMPADLSGGMVKRIALARALVLEPELIFLDEPTAGLDPDRSESFVSLVQSLHRKLNLTVVMITHDLDTLVSLSDRIAVLAEGRVLANAPLHEIVNIDHPFIRNYFQGERGKRALSVAPPPGRSPH